MHKLVIPEVDLNAIRMPTSAMPLPDQIQEITVAWDTASERIIVNPSVVPKGTTVRFKDPRGGSLRIVFLSPAGKEVDSVSDSEVYTLAVGGAYHFKCFFELPGAKTAVSPSTGGVIEVLPVRP